MTEQVPPPDSDRQRRLALFALVLLAPAPSLGVASAMIIAPGPVGQTIFTVCKVWIIALPAVWWLVVEKGRASWSRPRNGGLLMGTAIGAATAAIIVLAYLAIAAGRIDPTLLREAVAEMELDNRTAYVAAAAYWICVNSVIEEYVYRWFVFRQCERLVPAFPAVLLSAAVFTAHHVIALQDYLDPVLAILASFGVFVGGATWSWCYLRYRSIWPGWIAHAFADVAVFGIGWFLIFG